MSLLGGLGKKLKSVGKVAIGAVGGFFAGGPAGAVVGGLSTLASPSGGGRVQPTRSPSISTFSASPYVRLASNTGLVQLPGTGVAPFGPSQPPAMGGGGATGSFPSQMPMWAHRRLYTKKGTARRTRRDGMPYAVPRMNPMNVRAARRAIRRIRGARKLLQRIERSLPKQTHRRVTARRVA